MATVRSPCLRVIVTMWAFTIAQIVLQNVPYISIIGKLLGFASFVMAVFLVTRHDRAANINGGLRLGVWALGLLSHFALNQ